MITTYEKESKEYNNNIYLLKQSNTDLTHQLQHLLKKYYNIQQQQQQSGSGMLSPSFNRSSSSSGGRSSTGGGVSRVPAIVETGDEYGNVPMAISASAEGTGATSADDVISNFLVTFDSIEELQTRNQQLLQVVRKLTSEQVSVGVGLCMMCVLRLIYAYSICVWSIV